MRREIRELLFQYADKDYQTFSQGLIPVGKPLIGVRLPQLRKLAKEMAKKDYREELENPEPDMYTEEVMLKGMLIGYGGSREGKIDDALQMLDDFVPLVDNWSVCDSCCVSFQLFQKYRVLVYEHIQKFLYSEKEFEVRVGLILLLDHFLKCDATGNKLPRRKRVDVSDFIHAENKEENGLYIDHILQCVNRPFTQGYYAQMAAAWLIAECFVTFPLKTWKFIENNQLDTFTYNKALQKICESKTPSEEAKQMIRKKKRKA